MKRAFSPARACRLAGSLIALTALLAMASAVARAADFGDVSAQGLFTSSPGRAVSPAGRYQMEYTLSAAPENRWLAEITVTGGSSAAPGHWSLRTIPGPALLISDAGRIVSLESFDPPEIPATLRVFDLRGRLLHTERLRVATDPCLSPDGARLVCRTADGVVDLDLRTFEETEYPLYALFAPGPGGKLAGMAPAGPLEVHAPDAGPIVIPVAGDPVRLAWTGDGAAVLVLEAQRLLRIEPATSERTVLFTASRDEELRDLRVLPGGAIDLAMRQASGDRNTGWRVSLARDGQVLARQEGPTLEVPRADFSGAPGVPPSDGDAGRPTPSIPWPLWPNAQHPVGNTYNEYQNYGGSPYPHPGVDVFGSAGQAVYAVHNGVVKAVLTTGGELYWRVAIADTIGNGTLPGYLYAHLEQSSIAVNVGQAITAGQYIGDLILWPITDFTHTHFARIEDTGAQWHGAWMSIANPHVYLQNQSDNLRPVFEPAQGNALLAFCANETSSYQIASSLHGAVDIIAHVGDRIVTTYVCTVQELRYTIYPAGHPGSPVVDDQLAVYFDMENDYYAGGSGYGLLTNILYKQDSTCRTQGDYDHREYYHILTNSDGDAEWGTEDLQACWDTSHLPDGQYVIRVVAYDVAGNVTSDSMTVVTANGNPSSIEGSSADEVRLQSWPNPAVGPASIRFSLETPGRVTLGIYDLTGRRVRTLLDAALAAGEQVVVWDGRSESGTPVPGGTYFWRLSGLKGVRTGRLVVPR
jgi:murein DD-endopeptidase MepM/ murein hydrolase activator NlpD